MPRWSAFCCSAGLRVLGRAGARRLVPGRDRAFLVDRRRGRAQSVPSRRPQYPPVGQSRVRARLVAGHRKSCLRGRAVAASVEVVAFAAAERLARLVRRCLREPPDLPSRFGGWVPSAGFAGRRGRRDRSRPPYDRRSLRVRARPADPGRASPAKGVRSGTLGGAPGAGGAWPPTGRNPGKSRPHAAMAG